MVSLRNFPSDADLSCPGPVLFMLIGPSSPCPRAWGKREAGDTPCSKLLWQLVVAYCEMPGVSGKPSMHGTA